MNKKQTSISVAGKEIILETGQIARQANGAVILKCGDTTILSTACASESPSEMDFFPLRVDYQEKFSSAGKTLGGFIKREGRPREKETLTSRLIDRPIRPMFPEGFFNEVQVLNYVMSYDPNSQPEPLAICASSAALAISDIPLIKPIGAVRVAMINGEFIINPTLEEQKKSKLDLLLAGTVDAILMIEGYCDFLDEDQVGQAIEQGHDAIKTFCQGLSDWQNLVGKEKFEPTLIKPSDELIADLHKAFDSQYNLAFSETDKHKRNVALKLIKESIYEKYENELNDETISERQMSIAIKKVSAKNLRTKVVAEKRRVDGRAFNEIRPIWTEKSILPRAHGSYLFTRGETQAMAVCTLGGESMGQRFETLDEDSISRFYLQYSFPPFSVGEVGRVGPPGRREVGHGKLAEKALKAVVPTLEEFPYTIRLESNITESNGSSSMASVCGGVLAMRDAGVPIKRLVSGIAMGLILNENSYTVLSDILGLEDALGDMDFKITGDDKGITAFQMDIKVEGITPKIMQVALEQAKEGRIHILKEMNKNLSDDEITLSKWAPKIERISVPQSKIALIIGSGGKTIKGIIEASDTQVEIDDDGIVQIISQDSSKIKIAKDMVLDLITEAEVGKTYKGPIVTIQPFGVFVKVPGSKEGLCHISELSHSRIENIEEHFKIGDKIDVKVLDINNRGQIKLSHKVTL